jgi:uncharacterized protein (TIGR00290 family)
VKRALVSWSGGKDAAWSLYKTRGEFEIAALVTTVAERDEVVPIHNIPQSRIAAQAEALGIPLWTVLLPQPCSNVEYAARLEPIWSRAVSVGVDTVIFGDLFLADIREWREKLLADTKLTPLFPLWMQPTDELAREMIRGGLRAVVCAAGDSLLIGREFDESLLGALPESVDPCGENGEFHTFVHDMPGFSCPV